MGVGSKRRVLVVDDNITARMGAKALLDATATFSCAAIATSGYEALELLDAVDPDLVLMDVNMDGLRGAETTRRMLARRPGLPVVAWTSSTDSDDLIEMIHAGCLGYSLKDLGPAELDKALSLALDGQMPIPRQLMRSVLVRARPTQTPPSEIHLTNREREVLTLLASGMLAKEVAAELHIAPKSVETYATSAYHKLGAKNRTQAIARALEWGLVGT